jgi:hypothetical protein
MKRIVLNSAEVREGVYWDEGVPFTGVGFLLGEEQVVGPCELQDGRVIGPYISLCEEGSEVALRIDLEGASGDYERVIYQGVPFTGMGYEFDLELCYYEGLFNRGNAISEIWWKRSGEMSQCRLDRKDFSETCDWHDNGVLGRCEVTNPSLFRCSVSFLDDGSLSVLGVDRGTLDVLPAIAARSKFFPLRGQSDIARLRAAMFLRLIGDGIDDELFAFLGKSQVLVGVEKLSLFHTILTQFDSLVFDAMPHLKEVEIEEYKVPQGEFSRLMAANWPTVKVIVNRARVL